MATAMEVEKGVAAGATEARSVEQQEPLARILTEMERLRKEADAAAATARADSAFRMCENGNIEAVTFSGLQRMARMYADSGMVPDHYKGNVAACAIAIQLARKCRIDPILFMQKSYMVHGKPGIEAKLAIAIVNTSGILQGRIRFSLSGSGDNRQCIASATIKDTEEQIEEIITVEMAKSMGWWSKKDSAWPKMTDKMLKYRSASWLIDVNMPEALMGLQFKDALDDEPEMPHTITGPITMDDLMKPSTKDVSETNGVSHTSDSDTDRKSEEQADTSDDGQIDESEINESLAGFADALDACDSLGDVAALEAEFINKIQSADLKRDVLSQCDLKRESIRAAKAKPITLETVQEELDACSKLTDVDAIATRHKAVFRGEKSGPFLKLCADRKQALART